MSQVHETAYPTLASEVSDAELLAAFTPSAAELRFVRGQFRQMPTCVVIVAQLKLLQRLGYFPLVSTVPPAIILHVGKALKARPLLKATLARYDKSGSKSRHQKLLREFVGIQPTDADAQTWLATLATDTARTKAELPDIINVLIEVRAAVGVRSQGRRASQAFHHDAILLWLQPRAQPNSALRQKFEP
jgi:hypothetical protein